MTHLATRIDSFFASPDTAAMKQLTIRGFESDLEKALVTLARAEGISLNQAALRLMRRGAGLSTGAGDPATVGDSLDHVIGSWSDAEAEAFRESLRTLDTTDESLWS